MRVLGTVAAAVLCGAVLTACGSSGDKADPKPDATTGTPVAVTTGPSTAPDTVPPTTPYTAPPAPTTTAPISNRSFPKGSCVAIDESAPDGDDAAGMSTVSCKAPEAVAKVVEREPFDVTRITDCYDSASNADRILDITRLGTGKNAGRLEYAPVCLRNLTAPHPGDPGQGGGTNIIKGDCLQDRPSFGLPRSGMATSNTTTVETACAGTGADKPAYRVIGLGSSTIVKGDKGVPCPRGTQVTFTAPDEILMGAVYCAVRL